MAYHEQITNDAWLSELEYQIHRLRELQDTHEYNLFIDSTKLIEASNIIGEMIDAMNDELANTNPHYI
jgi:hypothetical protein